MNLFAYGTLMWPEILADVIGRSIEGAPAVLRNARRQRVKDQVYPSLVPAENAAVDGILYLDLTEAEVAALDRFEGEEYTRCTVDVRDDSQTFRGEVYFASEQGLSMLQPEEWKPDHLSEPDVQHFRDTYRGWET